MAALRFARAGVLVVCVALACGSCDSGSKHAALPSRSAAPALTASTHGSPTPHDRHAAGSPSTAGTPVASSTAPKEPQHTPPKHRASRSTPASSPIASGVPHASSPVLSSTPAPVVTGPVATTSVSPAKADGYKVFTNTDGTVVRWNPCAPIHYVVNAADASDPAGVLRDVKAAVGRIASATGLAFVFDGGTSVVPTKAWLDDGKPATPARLLIAWASPGTAPGESDLFGADADGEGGWWEAGQSADGTHWVWQIERGFVVIDPKGAASYSPGFGPGESRGVLLMHELGHAVGLGHTGDRADVMFPVITSASRGSWGPGDLEGLALVGKQGGCIGAAP